MRHERAFAPLQDPDLKLAALAATIRLKRFLVGAIGGATRCRSRRGDALRDRTTTGTATSRVIPSPAVDQDGDPVGQLITRRGIGQNLCT